MSEIFVCTQGEMNDGDVKIVTLDDLEVGVYRHAGQYFAYRNFCVHQGGPACEGIVIGRVKDIISADNTFLGSTFDHDDPHIVCPWHGYEYRLLTGENPIDPKLKLKSYEVALKDGGVFVIV